ncbi:ABC transporter permease [Arthrobacter sp. 179]|uniref:ABC transporter permease n=1 Tax=Arthrobacter sp. 179 TaxID=3457734 RepID=UPI0040333609
MPTPDTVERPATGPDPTEPAGPESGPDRLPMPAPATRRDLGTVLLPAAALLVLICLWQILSWSGLKRPDLFPGPGAVAAGMGDALLDGTLQNAVATSLGRGVTGFAISVAIATPLALLLAQSATLRAALGPLVSGLQVLPSVAWVPAAIIWFGLTDATVYFVVLMGATPSIVNGLLSGIDQIPPHYGSVGTVLGATRRQQTLLITLPAALPAYLGGLKQGWAFSWRSLMAAEIIAVGGSIGFGLGSMLQQGRDLSSMALVMAAILVILSVGIIVELLVFSPIQRRLLQRRGLLTSGAK